MGFEFHFEGKELAGGATVVDYGLQRIGERRSGIDPLLKEQDEIAAVSEKLRGFIAREMEVPEKSLGGKIGGFMKGMFGRKEVQPAEPEKVTLAKNYLGRLDSIRETIGAEIRRMAKVDVEGMPSQRLDSLDRLRNDAFEARQVSHELGWVVGAAKPIEKDTANEASYEDEPFVPVMGENVESLARARARKERLSANSRSTVPSATVPRRPSESTRGGFGPAALSRGMSTGKGARPIIHDDTQDYLTALERRNDQLAVMDAKLEDKIAKLESTSTLSKIGSFFRGNTVSKQLTALKEEKSGVVRRCREIEAKIRQVEASMRKVA